MEDYHIYDPETATNLYAELQEAYRLIPDYKSAYLHLNRIFQKCLNERTNFPGVRFGGAFAKTDYLLKEHHAPRYMQRSVNDARVRLRQLRSIKPEELLENFSYDFKAICQFVGLVYHVPVPGMLKAVFPEDRICTLGELKADCLRIIVNRWDDTYIYADADVEGSDEVKVFYGGKSEFFVYQKWDWSYLRTLLKEGCQLNIVRPRVEDGVLYPELMIWEPDYLIDISAIANCFEQYAVSPLNHLISKIKPSPNTQPILLGNFASQFLDEILYLHPGDCSYQQSVKKFFQSNALSLLTVDLSSDFHSQAQSQKQIIHDIVREKLPEILPGRKFDSSEVMVEPSFFSEMLGLQGRMDFMMLDQSVIIEQKAGKCGFPQREPDTPVQAEKHYVQLLLYMLLARYNFRDIYEGSNHRLQAFLLYSKYRNGLLLLSFAPQLVFEAIKVRNGIAALEYDYSRKGLKILENLTPDSLNLNQEQGKLWTHYQKPQLNELLRPIQEASDLERAYYLRFMKFIETEHLMSKVGNQTKENSGFADKWHSSLEDKLLAGNIYCDLEMLSPGEQDTGRVSHVVLGFVEKPEHEISNFRIGDIVILYSYQEGMEPDARKSMVFRANIESMETDKIVLNLLAAQTDTHVFWYQGRRKWAIEHDFYESSYGSLYQGMHAFLSALKSRRDLLLLQRSPQTDKTKTLKGDYGDFNELSLKVKQAQDLFLIIGPPGTGKTSYGLLNTLREELLSTEDSVLLLSFTNRAVDEICSKLTENDIDFIRIGSRFSCEEVYRSHMLASKVENCANVTQLKEMIDRTRVFVGTTSTFNKNIHLFKLKQFSLAIIDEASQILEPHLIGLLSATTADGLSAIKKMVLIGDHKQLPAVVQQREEESAVDEPLLRSIHLTNCRLSLFERLLRKYRADADVTFMLTKQGRMHHDIAQFPNYTFYQNKLQEVPLRHQNVLLPVSGMGENGIKDILLTRRLAFIAVPATLQSASDKVNKNEALAIAATVAQIYELNKQNFSPLQTVGVIVPYRNQISEIRNCLDSYGIPQLRDITVDTVERYQGSQRDYIIYGFTVQKYYQLAFLTSHVFEEDNCIIDRKLNVAMTRAREHLLLFGNPELLSNNITFYKLMEFVRSKHGFFSVPLEKYVQGRFTVPMLEHDWNISQAAYPLSPQFAKLFEKLVLEPIRNDNRTVWPDRILGRNMQENMEIIDYGRKNLSRQNGQQISKDQTFIYCHYLMRMYYCGCKTVYGSCQSWLNETMAAHHGRVQLIDIGCGPATAGIAFAEQFAHIRHTMGYVGIEVSEEMKIIGKRFLDAVFQQNLRYRFISGYRELTVNYWDSISELSSLVIFNFTYVFSHMSAQFAERLAQMIGETMQRYSLNTYVFIIQHSVFDQRLNSYLVFKRYLTPYVYVLNAELSSFHYRMDEKEHSKDFYYEILVSH